MQFYCHVHREKVLILFVTCSIQHRLHNLYLYGFSLCLIVNCELFAINTHIHVHVNITENNVILSMAHGYKKHSFKSQSGFNGVFRNRLTTQSKPVMYMHSIVLHVHVLYM